MLGWFARAIAIALAAAALGLAACSGSTEAPATAPPPSTRPQPSTTPAPPAVPPTSTTTAAPVTTTTVAPTTSTTTTTTTTLPPLVIGVAGDTSFTNGNAGRDPLAGVTDLLSGPDVMVVNLETAVAEPGVGRAFPKRFTFKSPPESAALLAAAGVDVVQLANNHTLDFGPAAVDRTLVHLDEAGLLYVGGGRDEDQSYTPLLVEAAGRTIGMAAFARVPCDWSASGNNTRPEVAWTCPVFAERALATVAEAAARSDVTIVLAHGGTEGVRCPEAYRRELTLGWVAAGADAVIWSHPHVLQGVERIDGAWVLYSTGNFAFPSARGATADTAVFTLTFDDGGVSLAAIPVNGASGRPRLATERESAAILALLSRYSFGVAFDETGTAVATTTDGDCGPPP